MIDERLGFGMNMKMSTVLKGIALGAAAGAAVGSAMELANARSHELKNMVKKTKHAVKDAAEIFRDDMGF